MFITVNGKIIPCERIDHDFSVGYIHDEHVELDYKYVADRHNYFVSKHITQCEVCSTYRKCTLCVYQLDNIRIDQSKCLHFRPMKEQSHHLVEQFAYLREHPEAYQKILNEVSIRW